MLYKLSCASLAFLFDNYFFVPICFKISSTAAFS